MLPLGVTLFALLIGTQIPSAIPTTQDAKVDSASIQTRVLSFAETWQPDVDPLVEVRNHTMAKRSNANGVIMDGTRYYYMMPNAPSYDPITLGVAKEYEVISVVNPGTHWEVVIYRLPVQAP